MKEDKSNFNLFETEISDQMKRLYEGMAISQETKLMQDFLRLGKMGCFKIRQSVPDPIKAKMDTKGISVEAKTPFVELYWDGEGELDRLNKENTELKEQRDELLEALQICVSRIKGDIHAPLAVSQAQQAIEKALK